MIEGRAGSWLSGLAVSLAGIALAACHAPPLPRTLDGGSVPPWVESIRGDGPGSPHLVADASSLPPGDYTRSRRGNASSYEVFGQRYHVMEDATGYSRTGVASWYGKKFHGRDTSSGEPYDMHALSAAHRSLPLPTLARVTRLDNGKSVVVRVNDRGPFVDDRLIDLSYAAAMHLDMLGSGTARVRVEALHGEELRRHAKAGTTSAPGTGSSAEAARRIAAADDGGWYVQAGAFRDRGNAERHLREVAAAVDDTASLVEVGEGAPWRVRLGPFEQRREVDRLLERLADEDIDAYATVSR